jgi:YfiH family protein
MKLSEQESGGVRFWQVDCWGERGIFHGFIGSDVDGKTSLSGFEAFLSCRSDVSAGAARVLALRQIHSDEFIEVRQHCAPAALDELSTCPPQADGWLAECRSPLPAETVLCIRTADCVPVLFRSAAGAERQLCAALHCGWRGVLSGLLPKTLSRCRQLGGRMEEIELAFGPAAQSCCLEIGGEVAEQFHSSWEAELRKTPLIHHRVGKIFIDLSGLLRQQAISQGLLPENIVSSPACTICDKHFFSYRRQKADAGRQVSFISCDLIN